MWRRHTALSFTSVLSACFAGCALVQQPDESDIPSRQISMYVMEESEADFVAPEFGVSQLDLSQAKAGQHVQIWSGSLPEDSLQEMLCPFSGIAGTVKEISADRVVLLDVVIISAKPTQHAVPIAGKVPYFGRLFKNSSGVRREVTPVPGEVAIELSEILHAKELTDAAFEQVKQYGVERIGVDFDFNAAEGGGVTIQQL